jgi:lysophospholipase L1-like esterase
MLFEIQDGNSERRFHYFREIEAGRQNLREGIPHRIPGLLPIITGRNFSKMARMKKQNFAGLLAVMCLCAAPVVGHAQVKIMPFGDSVTSRGSDPESSYRYWLWKDLTDAGINNFVFIGNQSGVSDGTPANSWPQENYEGGDGLTSSDALDIAPDAATFDGGSDIVLLDFGSNDISPAGIPLDQTINNLQQVIQTFANQNPNVLVLIAKPTPFAPDPSSSKADQKIQKRQQSQLAGMIGKLARTEKKAGINVIAVDLFGGFNVKKDTVDGAHPDIIGEQKIATKFFKVLKKQLKNA